MEKNDSTDPKLNIKLISFILFSLLLVLFFVLLTGFSSSDAFLLPPNARKEEMGRMGIDRRWAWQLPKDPGV